MSEETRSEFDKTFDELKSKVLEHTMCWDLFEAFRLTAEADGILNAVHETKTECMEV